MRYKLWGILYTFDRIGNGYTENSLSAIQNCMDKCIEMIEIDIRTTKDGISVLMHDAAINRTTTGSGIVRDLLICPYINEQRYQPQ